MLFLFFLIVFALLFYFVLCNAVLGLIAGGLGIFVSYRVPALSSRWYASLSGLIFGAALVALISVAFRMSTDWTVFIAASPLFAAYYGFTDYDKDWFV